jgi:hypothetical protein
MEPERSAPQGSQKPYWEASVKCGLIGRIFAPEITTGKAAGGESGIRTRAKYAVGTKQFLAMYFQAKSTGAEKNRL